MWVGHSADYRGREQCLIPEKEWEAHKHEICAALDLELDVEKVLKEQLALAEDGVVAVAKALEQGLLRVDGQGSVEVPSIQAELMNSEITKGVSQTQKALDDVVGSAQIPDILLEIDRETGFSEVLLGRKAKDARELLSVYGGLLAAGTEVDAKSIAAMIPGLDAAAVTSGMRTLEIGNRLRDAGAKVVDFQQQFELVKSWGKLLRTVFLCDFFSNIDFRREIHTLLNRGESVHSLQRAIYYGRVTAERGRRRDELRAISGALTLITNIVIAWNTAKLQAAVQRLREAGQVIEPDVLRRIAPIQYGNINFRGTMKFDVNSVAEFLLRQERTAGRKQA